MPLNFICYIAIKDSVTEKEDPESVCKGTVVTYLRQYYDIFLNGQWETETRTLDLSNIKEEYQSFGSGGHVSTHIHTARPVSFCKC
jgi:hypothetical protein